MKDVMKTITVRIKGKSPLLMNNPISMLTEEKPKVTNIKGKRDRKKEADRVAYWLPGRKSLYFPSIAVFNAILKGSAYRKIGKYTAGNILAAGIRVMPEKIDLKTKNYDVDERTVVVKNMGRNCRIVRARPRLEKWTMDFEIVYDSTLITDINDICICLEEAGRRIGIGDFRPQCRGGFGTFTVEKFVIKKGKK